MLKALPTLFPNLLGTTNNPAVEFYNKFQRIADDHDRDFIKKYDEDLNSTLIFVSVFLHAARSLFNPTLGIGRLVLRSHIRFHYRRSEQARTGF